MHYPEENEEHLCMECPSFLEYVKFQCSFFIYKSDCKKILDHIAKMHGRKPEQVAFVNEFKQFFFIGGNITDRKRDRIGIGTNGYAVRNTAAVFGWIAALN